jgi:exopolysaccharide biosynthesis polyprenyl glycosylphosphotransferase
MRRDAAIIAALLLSDVIMLLASGFSATYLRFGTLTLPVDVGYPLPYWQAAIITAGVWVVSLFFERLYDLDRLTWSMGELSRVARALALGVLAIITFTFAVNRPGLSRFWMLVAWLIAVFLVTFGRIIVRWVIAWARRHGHLVQRTLVVGTNAEGRRIATALCASHGQGLVPVGCLSSEGAGDVADCAEDVPVLGEAEALADTIREYGVDVVIVASSAFDHDAIAAMISEMRGLPVSLHISSGLFEVLTSRVLVREVAGVPLITVKRVSLSPLARVLKRAFDILIAGALVIGALPFWLAVAVAIVATSRGPVFYRQERVGRGGRHFKMLKFRSMIPDADRIRHELAHANEADGPLFKMRDDPRITGVGRWMRRFSIDEFPQLLNVLFGDMSLVGPRPPLPQEVEMYGDYEWKRLEVLPGMTGLWQVSGRSDLSFDEMVRLDLFYIENWSLGFDISLLVRTLPAALSGRGAY